MIKNKSQLGFTDFLKEFYKDLKDGKAQGWWNERFSRKFERVNYDSLTTVYDIVQYVKDNYKELSQEWIDDVCNHVSKTHAVINRKRVYFWEVLTHQEDDKTSQDAVQEPESTPTEGTLDEVETVEEQSEEVVTDEVVVEEEAVKEVVVEKPIPDFDYAKTIEDKQELKKYAKSFGFKLDSRKSLSDMMKSFQGKYHSTKNK